MEITTAKRSDFRLIERGVQLRVVETYVDDKIENDSFKPLFTNPIPTLPERYICSGSSECRINDFVRKEIVNGYPVTMPGKLLVHAADCITR